MKVFINILSFFNVGAFLRCILSLFWVYVFIPNALIPNAPIPTSQFPECPNPNDGNRPRRGVSRSQTKGSWYNPWESGGIIVEIAVFGKSTWSGL